ncbi:MAG: polymerase beta, Nucleotidyltransferase [Herbinix sp.]|jgi:predicted nucleotidyltransferase|nr:polymerase beta, Nucleotidyltransferase [Herbinix sp.]
MNVEVSAARQKIYEKLNNNVMTVLDYIQANVKEIVEVGVFGSFARGTFTALSDSDLYVVSKNTLKHSVRGEVRCFAEEHSCDVVFFTEDNFVESHSLLAQKIYKERRVLYGP